jgi:hypothetical protein
LGREVYLDCPPGEFDRWVTEMQIAVAAVDADRDEAHRG